MSWFALAKLLFKAAGSVAEYLTQSKLIDGAQAQILLDIAHDTNTTLRRIQAVRSSTDTDWDDRMRRKTRGEDV